MSEFIVTITGITNDEPHVAAVYVEGLTDKDALTRAYRFGKVPLMDQVLSVSCVRMER